MVINWGRRELEPKNYFLVCMLVCLFITRHLNTSIPNNTLKFNFTLLYWASEASPTLGCSIKISRDICIYVGMSRMSN